jgi:WD40 repeat protein
MREMVRPVKTPSRVEPTKKWRLFASCPIAVNIRTSNTRSSDQFSSSAEIVRFWPSTGRLRLVRKDKTLKVWNLETGEALATFACDGATSCCAFSDALKPIVAGDVGGPRALPPPRRAETKKLSQSFSQYWPARSSAT